MAWSLSINKDDITDARVVEDESPALDGGQVRLRVDRFALTANNVTYAAFGHAMRYWEFFPGADGRGRLPVWGFAEISESRVERLETGTRVYGYFPAAAELVVTPGRITPSGFVDTAPHRAELAPAYNQYQLCAADPAWTQANEAAQMVLQPLFITAFLLDHHLRDPANGLDQAVPLFTSASSKTAIALAWLMRAAGRTAQALTSARNAAFVEQLGLYEGVTAYDALAGLSLSGPGVIVDFAGDSTLNRALHDGLAGQLAANIRVGGAHWDKSAPPKDLPPPRPQFFFAPDAARTLIKAWGQAEFDTAYKAAWTGFCTAAPDLFDFKEDTGGDGALAVYRAILAGQVPARDALTIQASA